MINVIGSKRILKSVFIPSFEEGTLAEVRKMERYLRTRRSGGRSNTSRKQAVV